MNSNRITLFPAGIGRLMRQYTHEVTKPTTEHAVRGWSKSPVDPMRLLVAFPGLRLKKGFVLRAYWDYDLDGGYGLVWAMPENLPFPEPDATWIPGFWVEYGMAAEPSA